MKNIIAIIAAAAFLGFVYYVMTGNDLQPYEGTPTEKVDFVPQPIEEVVEDAQSELDEIESLEAELDAELEDLENLDF